MYISTEAYSFVILINYITVVAFVSHAMLNMHCSTTAGDQEMQCTRRYSYSIPKLTIFFLDKQRLM